VLVTANQNKKNYLFFFDFTVREVALYYKDLLSSVKYYLGNIFNAVILIVSVTARHMHTAAAASAPDHGGSTSPISKGNAGGKQAMYI
jgi:hypothetical protein